MKLEMHKNSLFAVLMRQPWWVSMLVAVGIAVGLRLVLPVFYAVFAALPFAVIAGYVGWRQLREPSTGSVVATLDRVRAMSLDEFIAALEAAYRREGYEVKRLTGAQADLELKKAGRTTLVACKRWKAARTGIEPLRELEVARNVREAQEAIYVAAGEVTAQAVALATEKNIRLLHGAELAKLLKR